MHVELASLSKLTNGAFPPGFCLFVIPEMPNVGFRQEKKTKRPKMERLEIQVGNPAWSLHKVRTSPGLHRDKADMCQLRSRPQCIPVIYSGQD